MDKDLQRLARELQAEKCPRQVLERVRAQIVRRGYAPGLFRTKTAALAFGLMALVSLSAILRHANQPLPSSPPPVDLPGLENPVQAAQQARVALAYVGTVLLQAGVRAEDVILEKAAPPMRNGLETVGNKLKIQKKL